MFVDYQKYLDKIWEDRNESKGKIAQDVKTAIKVGVAPGKINEMMDAVKSYRDWKNSEPNGTKAPMKPTAHIPRNKVVEPKSYKYDTPNVYFINKEDEYDD